MCDYGRSYRVTVWRKFFERDMRIDRSMNRTRTQIEFEGMSDMVQIAEDRCNDAASATRRWECALLALRRGVAMSKSCCR